MLNFKILISKKRSLPINFIKSFSNQPEVRVRFAPSPTGNIHLGGLRTALYNYIFAKQNKGKFLLRIEDTDQSRIVQGSAENIENVLKWANIEPDESPILGGNYGPYKQSERLQLYVNYAQKLVNSGKAYRCFCSSERLELLRKYQARNREKPRYDGKCKQLSPEEVKEKLNNGSTCRHVIRFALKPETTSFEDLIFGSISHNLVDSNEGDPIILKSDQYPTYHFANVIDDYTMKISHVLRGSEWISSTTKHIQLYKAFDWEQPIFAHFPLITMQDGSKMSKRNNHSLVSTLIDSGYRPLALINFITNTGGGLPKEKQNSTEIWDLETIVRKFNFQHVTCRPASTDMDRLRKFNSNDIKKSWQENPDKVLQEFKSILLKKNIETDLDDTGLNEIIKRFIDGRIVTLFDLLSEDNKYIWQCPNLDWPTQPYIDQGIDLKVIVMEVIGIVQQTNLDDKSCLDDKLGRLANNCNVKKSTLFMLLRKLLTNRDKGLPLFELFSCLGQERLVDYLRKGLKYVS